MFVDNFTPFYYMMFIPIALWAGLLAWRWVKAPELGEQVYASNVEKGLGQSPLPTLLLQDWFCIQDKNYVQTK